MPYENPQLSIPSDPQTHVEANDLRVPDMPIARLPMEKIFPVPQLATTLALRLGQLPSVRFVVDPDLFNGACCIL